MNHEVCIFTVVISDTTSTSMWKNMTQVNTPENPTLSTRRSVKFKGKDEEISDVEIDRDRHGLHSRAWGPFLEAPGNYRAR